MRLSRPVSGAALAALSVPLLALGSGGSATAAPGSPPQGPACPAGTVLMSKVAAERAFERADAGAGFEGLLAELDAAPESQVAVCAPVREPEPFAELAAMQRERNVISAGPLGTTPAGALRAAISRQAVLAAAPAVVPGAQGEFTPLGTTPLLGDEEGFDSVNGQGLADIAGRVDSFAYDEANDRLLASPGTGGVWLSEDLGGSWRSIGDDLPYQSVGAVDVAPTGGDGTIVVLSGEASAGGNVYTGIGAFWSDDLGATWTSATGIPDGLMGFEVEVDPTDPSVVYAATSQGLFRSEDAGRSYDNVVLPTGRCAGLTGYDNDCQNGNWVTDVEVKAPGGVGEDTEGGQVLAAVGYRAGQRLYPGTDLPQSPQNGLYRSDTGEVGSFAFLDDIYAATDTPGVVLPAQVGALPVALPGASAGFAPQPRVGRTELGAAYGPEQDHDVVYAIVEDAVLFNGGLPTLDAPEQLTDEAGPLPANTALSGIYVSEDFGSTWTRMADELELQSPLTGSALIGTSQTAGMYAPGIQSWYNMFIEPDPTSAAAGGVPDRLVFGLEEVWESRSVQGAGRLPQDGATQSLEPLSFEVIGPYFSGDSCAFLANPLPVCATQGTQSGDLTTHPDQQGGAWVPDGQGGVTLVIGNDGGVYTQSVAEGEELVNDGWGRGANTGFHTLLPYDASIAKDGTVWYGLQDNGSGFITPEGRQVMAFGGDGFFAAVDPDDSQVAYTETTLADMRVTMDGGRTWRTITPPVTAPLFSNPFTMDPTDSQHLITAGPEVVETVSGPDTGLTAEQDWVQVYSLDADLAEGEPSRQMTAVDLQGAAAYVASCSTCDIANVADATFRSGLATNVGGDEPAAKASPAGWHTATAAGLPERYITSIAVDPADPETVYVTLAGYANRLWWPLGSFNDANPAQGEGHVYRSTDAGESFTDISGDLPDVPARWVEINQGQLFVGTDIGLFLSSDTQGSQWAALDGLPAVPVSTVKTDPSDEDRVVLATFGRGVYAYSRTASVLPPTTPTAPTGPAAPGAGGAPGGAGGGAPAGPASAPAPGGVLAARPAGGVLAATGLPAVLGLAAVAALAGAGALRRRTAGGADV